MHMYLHVHVHVCIHVVLSGDGASTLVSASVRCMDTRHMCTGTVWGIYPPAFPALSTITPSSHLSTITPSSHLPPSLPPLHHHSLLFTSPPSLPPLTSHHHSLLSPPTLTSSSPPSLPLLPSLPPLTSHHHFLLSTITSSSPPSLTPLHPHSHLPTITHTSPPSLLPLHLSTITPSSTPSLSLLPGTAGEELASCGEDSSLRVWNGQHSRSH